MTGGEIAVLHEYGVYRLGSWTNRTIYRFSHILFHHIIQRRLYDALGRDLIGTAPPILALDLLDDLEDVFKGSELDLPSQLNRYKDCLVKLKKRGVNPWKDRPGRSDMHNMGIAEAVGHFHLYAWWKDTWRTNES